MDNLTSFLEVQNPTNNTITVHLPTLNSDVSKGFSALSHCIINNHGKVFIGQFLGNWF